MKIQSVEAIPLEMPLKKVFSGSGYRVTSRNTIITRIRTPGGLQSAVYNGDNRAHGREIARIIADELAPRLIGKDAGRIEMLWAEMFTLTVPNRDRKLVMKDRLRRYGAVGPPGQIARRIGLEATRRGPRAPADHRDRRLLRGRQDAR